ncbi:DUF4232 domain-containing protein [Actinokineospora sp. 24-640]
MRGRVIGTGALLVALAGCGAPPPVEPASGTQTSIVVPVEETSSEAAATTTTTAPRSSSAATGTDCKAAELGLSIKDDSAAAGTVYRELVFTNTGQRTCTMQGFPGVSYVAGKDGHQVGPAAYRDGAKGRAVSLAPGAAAVAPVGFVNVRNYEPAVCEPTEVRGLRVYPPQETESMFVAQPGVGCAGNPPGNQLIVKTVEAG